VNLISHAIHLIGSEPGPRRSRQCEIPVIPVFGTLALCLNHLNQHVGSALAHTPLLILATPVLILVRYRVMVFSLLRCSLSDLRGDVDDFARPTWFAASAACCSRHRRHAIRAVVVAVAPHNEVVFLTGTGTPILRQFPLGLESLSGAAKPHRKPTDALGAYTADENYSTHRVSSSAGTAQPSVIVAGRVAAPLARYLDPAACLMAVRHILLCRPFLTTT